MVGFQLVTPPAIEPLTVADVKAHLRLDYRTGELAPTAPTAAVMSPAQPGDVDNGAHRYLVTFVTAAGETEAGDATAAVTITDSSTNGAVRLTNIPLGGSNVTARRIYRTTSAGTTYLLLATLNDNTTTVYTDSTADAALGTEAPSVNTTDDPYLLNLITTARLTCEHATKRRLITQTVKQYFEYFPACGFIELFLPPCQAISAVEYRDTNGTLQTLSTDVYGAALTGERAEIYLKDGQSWPTLARQAREAVSITSVVGYGSARSDVPAPLRQGMLMLIGHYWNMREDVIAGTIISAVPKASEFLWNPYISREF